VGSLFGALAGDALGQLQDFVADRAGGNPLFVEEIVRSLVSKGVLVRQGDRWASTGECTVVDVPPTLHGLLLSRVDRLPADVRRLLQEMAVLGAVFEETLLCDVATDPSAIEGVLSRLTEADLIQPAGQGPESKRFRFTHTLVHEVVYQNLPPLA